MVKGPLLMLTPTDDVPQPLPLESYNVRAYTQSPEGGGGGRTQVRAAAHPVLTVLALEKKRSVMQPPGFVAVTVPGRPCSWRRTRTW